MSKNTELIFQKQPYIDSDSESISEIQDEHNNTDNNDNDNNDNIDNSDNGNDNLLTQIDRKVILKCMKEGKNTKTYIIGLEGYLKDSDQISFVKEIQKKLGTSMLKKMTEDKKPIYGLGGDHINSIFEFLIKKNIVKSSEIKRQ